MEHCGAEYMGKGHNRHSADRAEDNENPQCVPEYARNLAGPARREFLGTKLGNRPPKPKIKQTKVADNCPSQGEYAEALGSEAVEKDWNCDNPTEKGKRAGRNSPDRVAEDKGCRGRVALRLRY